MEGTLTVAARQTFWSGSARVPWRTRWHWRRLGRAMQAGRLSRAERLCIAYLRKYPQDSTSWEVWSEVLHSREQHHDEERILRRGVDFTGAASLRIRLARILASKGDLEEATATLGTSAEAGGRGRF